MRNTIKGFKSASVNESERNTRKHDSPLDSSPGVSGLNETGRRRSPDEHTNFELKIGSLNRIMTSGSLATGLDDLFETVLDQIISLFDLDCGCICMVDEETSTTRVVRSRGMTPEDNSRFDNLSIHDPGAKKVFVEGRVSSIEETSSRSDVPFRFFSVPLFFRDSVIGSITLGNLNKYNLDKEEIQTLITAGKQIGNIIQRIRLEESLIQANRSLCDDIRERKEIEENLRDSENLLRTLVENMVDCLLIYDEKGEIIFANKASVRTIKTESPTNLMGKHMLDFVHPDSRENVRRSMENSLAGRRGRLMETKLVNVEGGILWTESVAVNIRVKGSTAVIVTLRDITERKKSEADRINLQNQLWQAQKMEAIGTLAGGIAHDFNNILSAIMGYTEMASIQSRDNPEAEKNIHSALTACERAKDLIAQILSFSRHDTQELKPVNLQTIFKEALKLLRASIPSTIKIKTDIDNRCSAVNANPTQMHQVLMNLCTNASHSMRETGGVLSVRLMDDPDGRVRLSVSDTGHGIPDEIRERIFEPYFTTKEKGEGTGLGLSVIHGIVKGHGGTISVTSSKEGSTFDVYLPAIEPAKPIRCKSRRKNMKYGKGSILFVDDEPSLTDIGQQMLEHLGYDVTATVDSAHALQIFSGSPESFDLIITDMTMPNLTGEALAKECLAIRPDIPVILCTGFSSKTSQDLIDAGLISGFMQKPFEMQSLSQMVDKIVKSSSLK